MRSYITEFLNDENGAVTVDWVVLTAAVVGLGMAAVATTETGITDLASRIESSVSVVGVEGVN